MVTRFLRTCVTERQGAERYTDAVPGSGSYVGVFNPSSTNLPDQYSSSTNNCTIPQIMTMTTDKQSLKDRIAYVRAAQWYGGSCGHGLVLLHAVAGMEPLLE